MPASLLLLIILLASTASAQFIVWQKTLGGTLAEEGYGIALHPDGGYVIAGVAGSTDGDVSGIHLPTPPTLPTDAWVVKLNASGGLEWQKCLGGTEYEAGLSIAAYADGSSLMAGYVVSNDGDVSGNHGGGDAWLVKLDSSGGIVWQKCLGGTGNDVFYSVFATPDGGAIATGSSASPDGDVSGNHGDHDVWVVKVNATGDIEWQKCFGGSALDVGLAIDTAPGGGYIIAGVTESADGDVSGAHGGKEMWVVKLSANGTLEWQKCAGGTLNEVGTSLTVTSSGGYLVAGYTTSINGDVTGNNGNEDAWVVKLDASGNMEWQQCYGGSNYDRAYGIKSGANGSFFFTGYSDYTLVTTPPDLWVVKANEAGLIQGSVISGGTGTDQGAMLEVLSGGNVVVAGSTNSSNGDVTGLHGSATDMWVVQFDNSWVGTDAAQVLSNLELFPNPAIGDELHLRYSLSTAHPVEIEITDASGKHMHHQTIRTEAAGAQECSLDVHSFPAGFYLLQLKTEDGTQSLKWVKACGRE